MAPGGLSPPLFTEEMPVLAREGPHPTLVSLLLRTHAGIESKFVSYKTQYLIHYLIERQVAIYMHKTTRKVKKSLNEYKIF
jgi:hypothetical protein